MDAEQNSDLVDLIRERAKVRNVYVGDFCRIAKEQSKEKESLSLFLVGIVMVDLHIGEK